MQLDLFALSDILLVSGKSGSCAELRKLSGVREDGDYDLLIHNQIVSVSQIFTE